MQQDRVSAALSRRLVDGDDAKFGIEPKEAFIAVAQVSCTSCWEKIEVICIHCQSGRDLETARTLARLILAAALSSSALQPKLLNKVPATDQPMVAAAVSAVIGTLFDPAQSPTAAWVLLKDDVIEAMVSTALTRLGATDLAQSRLAKLAGTVQTEVSAITNGQSWDTTAFATAVQTALAA